MHTYGESNIHTHRESTPYGESNIHTLWSVQHAHTYRESNMHTLWSRTLTATLAATLTLTLTLEDSNMRSHEAESGHTHLESVFNMAPSNFLPFETPRTLQVDP